MLETFLNKETNIQKTASGIIAAVLACSCLLLPACSQSSPSSSASSASAPTVEAGDGDVADGAPASSLYNLADTFEGLDRDNVYKVVNAEDMLKFREHGTGILFFGFASCPACKRYVPMLDALAKEHGIDKVIYYDLEQDRKENTDTYKKVLSEMDGYTKYNADGDERLFVPSVSFIDHGEIVFYDDETSELDEKTDPIDEYWTDRAVTRWQDKMSPHLDDIAKSMRECGECGAE